MSRPRGTTQAGLTLLEVVVVVGIVAVVSALAWNAHALRVRLDLRAAAMELLADLRAAQARAIGERVPDRAHGIEFPAGGDRYVLVVQDAQTRTPARVRMLPSRVRITHAQFGGVDPSSVWFTGVSLLGAPSGGGTVTFSGGGVQVCVRVLPATGRIRLAQTGCP